MAESAVEKPISSWRQRIIQARAIAARPWRQYRTQLFQGYLIAAIVMFAVLAVLAHTIAYFTFDLVISRDLQLITAPGFDGLMRFISWFGFPPQTYAVTLFVLVALWVSGLKWETVVGFVSAVGISVIGLVIKLVVARPRPDPNLIHVLAQVKDFSFPSGHVLFYTAFFGFIFFLAFTVLKPSWPRTLLMVVFGGLVALVGISRIYEGEHWASDVLAAYLLSSVWLAFIIGFYRWGKTRYFARQPVAKAVGHETGVESK